MNPDGPLNILREVRDLQVVDRDGNNCGICDDVEFQGGPGEPLVIHGLLIGITALLHRLPPWISHVPGWIIPRHLVRVPWEDVENVTSRIKLKRPAGHYGLLRTDNRLAPYLKRIPSL
jgi:sporulation protein YlmC with PRC-barrel domain